MRRAEAALKGHILVVDDNEDNRDLLKRRLEREGYKIDCAAGGHEAIRRLDMSSYDLVLLDVMMPDIDGLEVLGHIRQRHSAMAQPVIMVTAQAEIENCVKALEMGANDYLTKPVDFSIALARIGTIMAVKGAESRLRDSEERFSLAVEGSSDGLWDWNLETGEIYFSPRWKSLFGYPDAEMENTPESWFEKVHADDIENLRSEIAAHIEGVSLRLECRYRVEHKNGSVRWMVTRGAARRGSNGRAIRIAGSQSDVTEQVVLDPLTKLPNRTLFLDRVERALLRHARRPDYAFGVLLMQLDKLPAVRDGFGRKRGDAFLSLLAQKVVMCLRPADTAAAFGDDLFAFLVDDIEDVSDAVRIANRVQQTLNRRFEVDGAEIFTTASIGIAWSQTGYDEVDSVIRDAQLALNRARELGGARHVVFDDALHQRAVARLEVENDLRKAIDNGELLLHYQPIIRLGDKQLAGFEALIRWQHPERGLIPPFDFIPLAEESGLILPIGDFVIREACRQMVEWCAKYPAARNMTVNVNASSHQLCKGDFADDVLEALEDTGCPAGQLKVEITESAIMENLEEAARALDALHANNVRVAIDDFGTGYSSLATLEKFDIDTLKIDKSFVTEIAVPGKPSPIVDTIIALAHGLGMDVVAEGIETQEHQDRLTELGCELGQGYFFARPMEVHQVDALFAHYQAKRTRAAVEHRSEDVDAQEKENASEAPADVFESEDGEQIAGAA